MGYMHSILLIVLIASGETEWIDHVAIVYLIYYLPI